MIADERREWIKMEMAAYDNLSPEMRAIVQEYGNLPWDPTMSPEKFLEHEQRMAQLEQEYFFTQGM